MTITPLLVSGCNFHNKTDKDKGPQPFPSVSVPVMLTGQEVAEYAASHYWNRYFDSTAVWNGISDTLIGGVTKEAMTGAVRDYIMALWSIPYDKAIAAQENLMSLAEKSLHTTDTSGTIYSFLTTTMESALYHPLSELRNEGFYIPVLESMIRTGYTGDKSHAAYHHQLTTCLNNCPGSFAADFTFTDAHGLQHSLYDIQSEYILLLFSNPGCPACREIIGMLKNSPIINAMERDGRIRLLSIYIDEDLAEWYKGLSDYPDVWITGYNEDLSIRDRLVYDVRAIPSLYLLDKDKRVIFKDISPGMLNLQLEIL
ncbi:MAG TPA: DUF5106 domain-containing protein [Candidatus Coprenecus stercoravium]|uniref:DUF5106 domain-containing protein n=1 Tax=Candidatus Coprenecus stercoravium TaxID=2840735 RepID=A0A9D2K8D7_9BACT|nr:DUF5106 domain-containing protein [Candidatus Coprenecus stercoravium]